MFLLVQVIVSDCAEPGEAEQKVMQFVRTLRSLPEYDPNTRHILYGQVAPDQISFLVSQEYNFTSSHKKLRDDYGDHQSMSRKIQSLDLNESHTQKE